MQFNALVLAGFTSLAAAASPDLASLAAQMPSCSLPCLIASASNAGCATDDYECGCVETEAISADSSACVMSSCSVADISTTQQVVTAICDAIAGETTSTITSTYAASNTTAVSSSTGSSSSSSSSGTTASSAASRMRLAGLGWAAAAGVVGYVVAV